MILYIILYYIINNNIKILQILIKNLSINIIFIYKIIYKILNNNNK